MLGLPKDEVFLCNYTDEWVIEFEKESKKILDIIERFVSSIHHIGSTAVPGLKAKPIIDIAIELFRFEHGFQCVEPLNKIGYKHRIIKELPERHYFSKGEPRTHQIHMYKPKSKYLLAQLTFRDKLRSDADLANKYQEIKEKISNMHSTDKLAYADAKTEFIKSVVDAT
jgi:GrpB-like predicted nucleotidyltransferase (UPF0157 family)